ncbi:hypothetical protein AURDEDRAFT_164086 [Auricularia subglabra TFB-10046 SS5]|nr:hypothetical protein AURDEDRAFT_164086 [Auricularia subglabra TFB-10046 SS5]
MPPASGSDGWIPLDDSAASITWAPRKVSPMGNLVGSTLCGLLGEPCGPVWIEENGATTAEVPSPVNVTLAFHASGVRVIGSATKVAGVHAEPVVFAVIDHKNENAKPATFLEESGLVVVFDGLDPGVRHTLFLDFANSTSATVSISNFEIFRPQTGGASSATPPPQRGPVFPVQTGKSSSNASTTSTGPVGEPAPRLASLPIAFLSILALPSEAADRNATPTPAAIIAIIAVLTLFGLFSAAAATLIYHRRTRQTARRRLSLDCPFLDSGESIAPKENSARARKLQLYNIPDRRDDYAVELAAFRDVTPHGGPSVGCPLTSLSPATGDGQETPPMYQA